MKLYQHKSGLMLREGSTDHKTLVEIKREYTWMPVRGKKVLDIGGCFGGYSKHAVESGASEVWVFEPEPRNVETIVQNLQGKHGVTVFNCAVVHDDLEKIPFYISPSGKSYGNFSTSKYRGRTEIKVQTKRFSKILDEFKPEVIKMDCEGQEFDLLREPLPDYVKYFTMEIHFNSPAGLKPTWLERTPQLIKQFDSWECVKKPKLSPTLWHTIGAWKR